MTPGDRLIKKLHSVRPLSDAEKRVIQGLPMTIRSLPARADIVCEGDRPSECCLLTEGMLFRYKVLPSGARQILSFHVPGDLPDLQSLLLPTMDHSLGALTPCVVAMIPHSAVLDLIRRHPAISEALWRDTLVDAAIFREWVANVGQRPAHQRIAHLMCEIYTRMKSVDLANNDECRFPLTQQELGDATGLSVVHVNRVLQGLRRSGLITLRAQLLTIPDLKALQETAMFDTAYLHLDGLAA